MSRRLVTLAVASVLVLALAAAGALLPVPYVALQPGPTVNTLGSLEDEPVIAVEGRRTYPADGYLNFVTIAYRGGPENGIDLFTALRGWIDPQVAVVPENAIFPEGQSVEEFVERTSEAMSQSQRSATTAALRELDIEVSTEVVVRDTQDGYPAHGVLAEGDVITAVDGTELSTRQEAVELVSDRSPGDEVTVTVRRDDETRDLDITTTAAEEQPDRAVVGAVLRERHSYPFTVRYHVGDVGGPSAGLMFAVGLVDKLSPGNLTGGAFVAGTGTVRADGTVGQIGGVTQKMIGARSSGATVFLTPSADCAVAAETAPDGLRLVRIDTLQGAVEALEALRAGEDSVPSCA